MDRKTGRRFDPGGRRLAAAYLPEGLDALPYFTAEELMAALSWRGEDYSRNGIRAVLARLVLTGRIRQVDRGIFSTRGCGMDGEIAPISIYLGGRHFRPRPEGTHLALYAWCRKCTAAYPLALLDSDWLVPLGIGPPPGQAVLLLETARSAVPGLRICVESPDLAPLRDAFPDHRFVVRPLPVYAPFETARGIDHPCLERILVDAYSDGSCRNAEVFGKLGEDAYDSFLNRMFKGYGLSLRMAARYARARRLGEAWPNHLLACAGLDLYCREERADLPVLAAPISAMMRSMASMSFGIEEERSMQPSSVTSASSSIRMPIPHSGTYTPGSTVNTIPHAMGTARFPTSWTSSPR
jgi:hypothetical protein